MIRKDRKSGFTLIEVMVAMAVLMIGLVGIIGVQVSGIHQLALARHRTIATQLGTRTLEYLKNVPVDINNPAQIFTDYLGNPLIDNETDNKALLYDDGVGDGYLTWHRLPPMKADGTMLPAGEAWSTEYFYLVIYGVEWGGQNGSTNRTPANNSELELAKYPSVLPGVNEIYIEIWVLWVQPGQNPQPGTLGSPLLKTVKDYFDDINKGFTNHSPGFAPKRKIVLKTIRRITRT